MSRKQRRRSRGFSLLEAMTAGVCLILGMIGVITLIQHVGRGASQADFNVQASKQAQELLSQTLAQGYTILAPVAAPPPVGNTGPCGGVLINTFPSGQRYRCTITFFDTSAAGPLPLIGQQSVLVQIIIERDPPPAILLLNAGRRLIVEGYAIPAT